jgi:hypothetical protein
MHTQFRAPQNGIRICIAFASIFFCAALFGAPVPLSTWKPLLSERPSEKIQKDVIKRGAEWEIHHIEDQYSYLNLDYYSLRVSKLPRKPGTTNLMTRADLLTLFSDWIMGTQRPSAERIVFEPADSGAALHSLGSVFLLKFQAFSFVPCRKITDCADIPWLNDGKTCEFLDVGVPKWFNQGLNRGYIVVSQVTPGEIRVATVRENKLLGAGDHPVAGNRAFGVMQSGNEWILYTIGADRATKAIPFVGDYSNATKAEQLLGEIGFCSAEVFWRVLLGELEKEIGRLGGQAKKGLCERKKPMRWDDAVKQKLWDPKGDWIKQP